MYSLAVIGGFLVLAIVITRIGVLYDERHQNYLFGIYCYCSARIIGTVLLVIELLLFLIALNIRGYCRSVINNVENTKAIISKAQAAEIVPNVSQARINDLNNELIKCQVEKERLGEWCLYPKEVLRITPIGGNK